MEKLKETLLNTTIYKEIVSPGISSKKKKKKEQLGAEMWNNISKEFQAFTLLWRNKKRKEPETKV